MSELFARLSTGLYQLLGLASLFAAAGVVLALILAQLDSVESTSRVRFSHPGFERGHYPDKSEFRADDLRAPALVAETLRRLGLQGSTEFQSAIRGALSVEPIIPANIIKERDRLRAAGQTPPAYVPHEFRVTLDLPPEINLSARQRSQLLTELVSVYRDDFRRKFGEPSLAFGTAFETLQNADFPEYELVLNTEVANIRRFLQEKLKDPELTESATPEERERAETARAFRSPTTNLSFGDLLERTELFSQVQLNEILGLIHENGLSRDRATALLKMNYYLRLLQERERRAMEEERVVQGLLQQTQARSQNYVLATKTPEVDASVLDQGLIDSLLANDAYNYLVRQALEAGLDVKEIQAEKARLIRLRDNMKSFDQSTDADQSALFAQTQQSLSSLATSYQALITDIRQTHADYARQAFGNAIRLTDEVRTPTVWKKLATAGLVGGLLGLALGAGLSLLGIFIGRTTSDQATAVAP